MLLLFHVFGGCTATILRGLTYPKILCTPAKEERKWRHHVALIVTFAGLVGRNRDVRVKHLVTQPGNAPKARPSHLTTADEVNKVSLKDSTSKTTKAESFRGRRPWTETQHVSVNASVSCCFQVYISCSVMMCEMEADNTRCSQGCINSGRLGRHVRREVVTQTSRHLVSQGPLRLKRSAEGAESPGNENRECLLNSTPAVFESSFTLCFSFLQWWTWTWTWSSSLDVFLQLSAWSVRWSCTKPKCQSSSTNLWMHSRAFQQREQNTGSVLFTFEDIRLVFGLLAARQEVSYLTLLKDDQLVQQLGVQAQCLLLWDPV